MWTVRMWGSSFTSFCSVPHPFRSLPARLRLTNKENRKRDYNSYTRRRPLAGETVERSGGVWRVFRWPSSRVSGSVSPPKDMSNRREVTEEPTVGSEWLLLVVSVSPPTSLPPVLPLHFTTFHVATRKEPDEVMREVMTRSGMERMRLVGGLVMIHFSMF